MKEARVKLNTFYLVLFIQTSRKCLLTYSDTEQIDACLGMKKRALRNVMGRITKAHLETFGVNRHIYFLYWGDGVTYIHKIHRSKYFKITLK